MHTRWCVRQTTQGLHAQREGGFPGEFQNRFGMEIITADLNDYLRIYLLHLFSCLLSPSFWCFVPNGTVGLLVEVKFLFNIFYVVSCFCLWF